MACIVLGTSRAVWEPHGARGGRGGGLGGLKLPVFRGSGGVGVSGCPWVPTRPGCAQVLWVAQGVWGHRVIAGGRGGGTGQGAPGTRCTQGHGGPTVAAGPRVPNVPTGGHAMPEAPRGGRGSGEGGAGTPRLRPPLRGARDEPRMGHQRAPAAMRVGAGLPRRGGRGHTGGRGQRRGGARPAQGRSPRRGGALPEGRGREGAGPGGGGAWAWRDPALPWR